MCRDTLAGSFVVGISGRSKVQGIHSVVEVSRSKGSNGIEVPRSTKPSLGFQETIFFRKQHTRTMLRISTIGHSDNLDWAKGYQ